MFTGLIEQQGIIKSNEAFDVSNRLIIQASFENLTPGESIAVNGVCLTLLPDDLPYLAFDVSPETLKLTNLGALKSNECVNLERAMLATSRFGGHYVNGHVDTTVCLKSTTKIDDYLEIVIGEFAACDTIYLLQKGSITIDGVSLTINEVNAGCVHLLLVPHTLAHTTLGVRKVGDRLNVEFDYLTQIVAHQLRTVDILRCTLS